MARRDDLEYYLSLWASMAVKPEKREAVATIARRILQHQARYRAVEALSGVPWPVVGVIHSLEGGGAWNAVLHNGERIIGTGQKTRLVPAGRGPFDTWEAAAVDALRRWRGMAWPGIGTILQRLEKFNGTGYASRGKHSPYLWSFTQHGVGTGKYVRDGKDGYDPAAVSQQAGAAAILAQIIGTGAWTPGVENPLTVSPGIHRPVSVVRAIQSFLNNIVTELPMAERYPILNVDGVLGPKTKAAGARFGIEFKD